MLLLYLLFIDQLPGPYGEVLTMYNVCLLPQGEFCTSEGYHDSYGGYREYIGGCSLHLGDMISTLLSKNWPLRNKLIENHKKCIITKSLKTSAFLVKEFDEMLRSDSEYVSVIL